MAGTGKIPGKGETTTNCRLPCEGINNKKHVAFSICGIIRIKYHLRHYRQQHPTQAAAERAEASRKQVMLYEYFSKVISHFKFGTMVSMNRNEKTHVFKIY